MSKLRPQAIARPSWRCAGCEGVLYEARVITETGEVDTVECLYPNCALSGVKYRAPVLIVPLVRL